MAYSVRDLAPPPGGGDPELNRGVAEDGGAASRQPREACVTRGYRLSVIGRKWARGHVLYPDAGAGLSVIRLSVRVAARRQILYPDALAGAELLGSDLCGR